MLTLVDLQYHAHIGQLPSPILLTRHFSLHW